MGALAKASSEQTAAAPTYAQSARRAGPVVGEGSAALLGFPPGESVGRPRSRAGRKRGRRAAADPSPTPPARDAAWDSGSRIVSVRRGAAISRAFAAV